MLLAMFANLVSVSQLLILFGFIKLLVFAGKKIEFITAGGRVSNTTSVLDLLLSQIYLPLISTLWSDDGLRATTSDTGWNPIYQNGSC